MGSGVLSTVKGVGPYPFALRVAKTPPSGVPKSAAVIGSLGPEPLAPAAEADVDIDEPWAF